MYSNTGQEVLFKSAFDAPPRAARFYLWIFSNLYLLLEIVDVSLSSISLAF